MAPWRPHHENSGFRNWVAAHHRDQGAGRQGCLGQEIRERRDAEPGDRGRGECRTAIRLESALRMDRDLLVSVDEMPGLRTLHERLMSE